MKKVAQILLGLTFVFGLIFGATKAVEKNSADPGGGIGGGGGLEPIIAKYDL